MQHNFIPFEIFSGHLIDKALHTLMKPNCPYPLHTYNTGYASAILYTFDICLRSKYHTLKLLFEVDSSKSCSSLYAFLFFSITENKVLIGEALKFYVTVATVSNIL